MKFPKAIGSYGIDLPDSVVNEIQDLSADQLKNLLEAIACKLTSDYDFSFDDFDIVTDEVINDQLQCLNDWLAFMSWVLEGLKHKVN